MTQRFTETLSRAKAIGFFSSVPSYPSDLNNQENAPFVTNAIGGYNHIGKAAKAMFDKEQKLPDQQKVPSDIIPR
ncbi:MAG: hypothetical protein KIH89_001290 [Candidatus Shapirobacteria bacterium]|nr:hypothetical protein [Candidatus Shapirobacteria bacterium]